MGIGRLFGLRGGVGSVTPGDAHQRQSAGSLLIDVRERQEWNSGHAPGAKHIPLGQLAQRARELPKDRELLVICRSGNRSSVAVELLQQAGFPQVHNVTGGMVVWQRVGLPVVK